MKRTQVVQDTASALIEPNMLHAHPIYVLAIAIVVLVLIGYVTLIRKKKI